MVDWESFYANFRSPGFVPGYEILNHLGGGAYGEVYKARKSSIGKSYAIKFLRLDEDSAKDAIDRELDQVRLFASIDHPHLVTMEDMGVVEGVPYLIMGYAGEETLARYLKQPDVDRERVLRYFVQACRGVLALHDRRLAHFDLKPSNIFLRGDVARVGDYGLAKLLVEGRQTLSFGRGTPHYMAPEMLKHRADHRADLYSLGVILYECVSGRLPYADDAALGIAVRDEDVPPEFPADFPAELRPIVTRLLRVDPEDRFPGVPELLEAMGQTARQGDSVRIRHDELPADLQTLQDDDAAAPARTEGDPASGDLRQTAAELARGAVGVARGVWDGVRERVSGTVSRRRGEGAEREPLTQRAGAASPERLGPGVVALSTLDDDAVGVAAPAAGVEQALAPAIEPTLSTPDAPWRRELERARDELERGPEAGLLAAAVPASVELAPATVPVPPRAEGGLVGNVLQSVVVGGEIMGALVTGPFLVALRGTATTFDRVLYGVPGILGALLRLMLLMLVMALVGGLVAFAFLAALSMKV